MNGRQRVEPSGTVVPRGSSVRPQPDDDVDDVAAGVAHDLNNFLQVVDVSLELLAHRTRDDPHAERLIAASKTAVRRAAELARRLLMLSRGPRPQLAAVRLVHFESTIGDLLRHALPPSIALTIRHADDLWTCVTDVGLLEAAVLDLALHARDAMPAGGSLHIEVFNRTIEIDGAADAAGRAGDFVVVSVRHDAHRIATSGDPVDPSLTTHGAGRGAGHGLGQVHAFARRCNGYATIDGHAGEGTEVRIHLPRAS